jgi:hypothetical protein
LSEFQPLLNRMMAKKRDERFADAGDLVTAIESLQRKRRKMTTFTDFDVTGMSAETGDELRKKRASKILTALLLVGLVMFSSLKYIEIRIKSEPNKNSQSSTSTVLSAEPVIIPTVVATPVVETTTQGVVTSTDAAATKTEPEAPTPAPVKPEPVSADVMKALAWLGKQSLEEYKLTYPPKDNAYYYFTRMLELDPGNMQAVKGILEISDRYAQQAEQALAKNQQEKMTTYIEYGLRINPQNESLLALKSLAGSQDTSLLGTIKSLFSK